MYEHTLTKAENTQLLRAVHTATYGYAATCPPIVILPSPKSSRV